MCVDGALLGVWAEKEPDGDVSFLLSYLLCINPSVSVVTGTAVVLHQKHEACGTSIQWGLNPTLLCAQTISTPGFDETVDRS